MIGRLTGVLAVKRAPQILVDCQGVGYEADVSMTTYYQLPEVGEQVSVWTHLQIKDDAHTLIGFKTEQERKLFRQLIRVNGVGPKMALTILSGTDSREFAQCVSQNDIVTLTRLPGVGKKTAERLIIEMRDKVDDLICEDLLFDDAGSWAKNYGMRIDHFLVSNNLLENVKTININKIPRGKIKPSDHTPIELEII